MSRVGRGTTTTFEHDDAFASLREEYAAVSPVIPPPTTTTSASALSASLANCGNVVDGDQYGVVSLFAVAIVIPFNVPRLGMRRIRGRRFV